VEPGRVFWDVKLKDSGLDAQTVLDREKRNKNTQTDI
jgi:hypothetical protein